MRTDVEASGATFRPWVEAPNRASRRPEDDPYRDWECSNPLQLFDRLLDTQFVGPAPGYAADVAAAIEELRPDLVVCSLFAIGAMVAAEAAGVPFDVVFPNAYLLPTPGIPPFGLGLKPAQRLPGRVRDRADHPPHCCVSGTRACPGSTRCARRSGSHRSRRSSIRSTTPGVTSS